MTGGTCTRHPSLPRAFRAVAGRVFGRMRESSSAASAALPSLAWVRIEAFEQIRLARAGAYVKGAQDWFLRESRTTDAARAAISRRTGTWRTANRLSINETIRLRRRPKAGAL